MSSYRYYHDPNTNSFSVWEDTSSAPLSPQAKRGIKNFWKNILIMFLGMFPILSIWTLCYTISYMREFKKSHSRHSIMGIICLYTSLSGILSTIVGIVAIIMQIF